MSQRPCSICHTTRLLIRAFAVVVGVIHIVHANDDRNDVLKETITATTEISTLSSIKNTDNLIPTSSPSNDDGNSPTTLSPIVPPPTDTTTTAPITSIPTIYNHSITTKAPTQTTYFPTYSPPPKSIKSLAPILPTTPSTSAPVDIPTTTTLAPINVPTPTAPVDVPTTTAAPIDIPTTTTKSPSDITTTAPTFTPTNAPVPSSTTPISNAPITTNTPITTSIPISLAPMNNIVPTITPQQQKHHFSFLQIIAKTIAWLIIILLSVIGFGACMNHRYRIYYFLRNVYYMTLRFICNLYCTNYIMNKLHTFAFYMNLSSSITGNSGNNQNYYSDVNTIIFDNDMNEGLLMRENDYD